ncbi:MAG TPA: hypothetical protein VFJ85_00180 [Acidimicrobiales bacterium]|nr:hypothetical protein [Acidimicrobiales bacterium]
MYDWFQSYRRTATEPKDHPPQHVPNLRVDSIPRWGRRAGVALTVALIDRLVGGKEAGVVGRVDLDQVNDRHEATRSEDRGRSVSLRSLRDPVVRRRREVHVGRGGRDVDHLEVANSDVKAIGGEVRPQLRRHRRADLDGMNRCASGKEVLCCLACSWADLDDRRIRPQHLEQLVEHDGGIRGAHLVIDLRCFVERKPDVARFHDHILTRSGQGRARVPPITHSISQWLGGPELRPIGAYTLLGP